MDHLLGLYFTSTWWALLYLIILCVAATVLDRIIGMLVGKALTGVPAKIVCFVLMSVACAGVLLGADALMDGVSQSRWSLVALALAAAALMVLPTQASGEDVSE